MKKSNSIVRTKTTHGNINNEMHYSIDFMLFWQYIAKKDKYIIQDYKFEIYPYKWYDIRWTYQKPSYWLLLKLFRKNLSKINKQKHNAKVDTKL